MQIFLKQFAKRMGQLNFSAFNKWMKVWGAGFLEKKNRSIIPEHNRLKEQGDGPLHCERAVADIVELFKKWLPMENFDNAQGIWQE
jgi:hypothetical protein